MIEKDSHLENVYAFDENFKEIYIGDVAYIDRGIKKKYFCLGCNKQMQAVKPQTKRKEHFRHHVKPNSNEEKCTYRDETHRHFLAKSNAFDLKKIKVPAVYKFSPNKSDEKAILLKESEFIEANSVLTEHYIFENENGEIQVSKNFDEEEEKFLFMKPDSIFLDKQGKPLLIIEFVATHKPDQNKLMKLKRLGIDAIQVTVPKSSPEEIRNIFFKTNRTKWLYNHAENEADYLRLSNSNAGGVFEIDNEQRRFYEEGFACRKAHLGDFIRALERLLESEHYREVEQNLRSEILRVEGNTEREATELEEIRRNYSESGVKRHFSRRESLANEQSEFRSHQREVEAKYEKFQNGIEIEQREVESEQRDMDEKISTAEWQLSGNDKPREDIEQSIDEETESVRILEERIEFDRGEEGREIERIGEAIEREAKAMADLPTKFERDKERVEFEVGTDEDKIRREIESLQRTIENAGGEFESDKKRNEEFFRAETERFIAETENGNVGKNWAYSREFLALGRLGDALKADKQLEERFNRLEQKNK